MMICQTAKHPVFLQPFHFITHTSSSKSKRHNLKTQNKEIISCLHSMFGAAIMRAVDGLPVGRAASYLGKMCVFCCACCRQATETICFSFFFFCAELSLILVSPHSYNIFVERKAFRTTTIFWWLRSVAFLSSFLC